MSALPPTSDDGAFWHLWLSPYYLPAITVADEIGLFAAISDQAAETDALAQKLAVDARALGIHLGLLAALGMVERHEGKWRSSALARTWMHPDGAGYYGPLLGGFRDNYPLHQQLLASLRSGGPAGREGHRAHVEEWERGELPLDQARSIAAFMHSHSVANSLAVARMPLWSDVTNALDVGGGSGVFAIELAKQWPGMAATILEIDTMCEAAQAYIDKADLARRVKTAAVDMFREEWPTGYDAHFFSNIFHDWSIETNRLLAQKSFAALESGGRIILHEILMDHDGTGPLVAAAFSVLMLLGTRGQQYTFKQLRDILASAGFVDVEAQTTGGGYYSLVTARKP